MVTLFIPAGSPGAGRSSPRNETPQGQPTLAANFSCRYKLYCVSLLAVIFLCRFPFNDENHFITLMESLGETAATWRCAGCGDNSEVPVFVFFTPIRRRVRRQLLRISALTFLVKAVVLLMARSILPSTPRSCCRPPLTACLSAGVLYAQQSTGAPGLWVISSSVHRKRCAGWQLRELPGRVLYHRRRHPFSRCRWLVGLPPPAPHTVCLHPGQSSAFQTPVN